MKSSQLLKGLAIYCDMKSRLEVEVEVMLRLTVSQSLCHGIEPALGLAARYYFLSEGCFLKVAVLSSWGALSDERSGLSFVFLCIVIFHYLHQIFTLHVFYSSATIYTINIKLQSVPSQYSKLCSNSYY
jgi:hypothetical protein